MYILTLSYLTYTYTSHSTTSHPVHYLTPCTLPHTLYTTSHPVHYLPSCTLPLTPYTTSHPVHYLPPRTLPHTLYTTSHPIHYLPSCTLPLTPYTTSHPVHYLPPCTLLPILYTTSHPVHYLTPCTLLPTYILSPLKQVILFSSKQLSTASVYCKYGKYMPFMCRRGGRGFPNLSCCSCICFSTAAFSSQEPEYKRTIRISSLRGTHRSDWLWWNTC